MLPTGQHAGFADLSFNSHFSSAQFPFSYPNQQTSFQLPDPNGAEKEEEEEEDEWAVYASSNKVDNGGSQVAPLQNGKEPTPSMVKTTHHKDQDRISNLQANPNLVKTTLVQEEEEEEDWGTFVSTPVAPQANTDASDSTRTTNFNGISQPKLGSINLHVQPIQYEEEWGEFVSSPVAAAKTDLTDSTRASAIAKWEKPKGPIPLSFFGGEEEESVQEELKIETLPNVRPVSGSHADPSLDVSLSNSFGVVKEIALSPIYGGMETPELKKIPSSKINGHEFNQDATTTTTNSMNGFKTSTSNLGSTGEKSEFIASKWDLFVDGENGVVEEVWGFKSAPSDMTASPLKEDLTNSWDPFSPLNEQAVSFPASELQMSSPGLVSSSKMAVHETDRSYSSESTKDAVLKFYRNLQEGSLLLISHHIKGHKEAPKMNTFVQQSIEDNRHEEIQKAYRVLKNLNISESLKFEGRSRDECINGLLNSTEEVYLTVFEREYQLSTKVLLALENLGAALDLLKHSLFTMNALEMTSMEGINSYMSMWYSLISVCLEELKNGASIWEQSFSANISDKLVSSGKNYFIALGEIYRIVEILKLTRKRFSSLLLLSNQNRLNELDMSLDICTKEWSSGLNVALETVSDGNSSCALNAKSLADSIKRISKVDIQNDDLYKEKTVCRLCLLPLALLSEMKSVTWHGDRYLIKLVNLWANKISPMPPILPSVEMK